MKNKKLEKLINSWIDGKQRSKYPLYVMKEVIAIYSEAYNTTINSTVVEILNDCGVKTRAKGIGWIVE